MGAGAATSSVAIAGCCGGAVTTTSSGGDALRSLLAGDGAVTASVCAGRTGGGEGKPVGSVAGESATAAGMALPSPDGGAGSAAAGTRWTGAAGTAAGAGVPGLSEAR